MLSGVVRRRSLCIHFGVPYRVFIRPRAGTSAPVDVKIDVSSGVLLPLSAGNHLAAGSCQALRKNVTFVTQSFSRLDRLSRIRMAFCLPTADAGSQLLDNCTHPDVQHLTVFDIVSHAVADGG